VVRGNYIELSTFWLWACFFSQTYLVDIIPREFLGEKVLHIGQLHQLRQLVEYCQNNPMYDFFLFFLFYFFLPVLYNQKNQATKTLYTFYRNSLQKTFDPSTIVYKVIHHLAYLYPFQSKSKKKKQWVQYTLFSLYKQKLTPPVGKNCPFATFSRMRSHNGKYFALTHSNCCACEQMNL
jgi:hypothetical protein